MATSKVYIPVAKIRTHLERVFSPAMTEKIMISLDLIFGECVYKQLLDKVQQVLLSNKQDSVMRFCFNLFDYNDDGLVCLHDMIKFNIEFAGVAVELINDHMDIT
jgi:Ca2+-binding EF-hand superfamily protein